MACPAGNAARKRAGADLLRQGGRGDARPCRGAAARSLRGAGLLDLPRLLHAAAGRGGGLGRLRALLPRRHAGRPAGDADGQPGLAGDPAPRPARQPGARPRGNDRAHRPAQGRDGHGRRVPAVGARPGGLARRGGARPGRARERVRARLRDARPAARRRRRARLRRDDPARDPPPRRSPGGPAAVGRALPRRARRRVPGHQLRAEGAAQAAGRRAPQRRGGGRRRPGHLPLPGRVAKEHPRLPGDLPGRQGAPAGGELPLQPACPRRSPCGRRAKRRAPAEEAAGRAQDDGGRGPRARRVLALRERARAVAGGGERARAADRGRRRAE